MTLSGNDEFNQLDSKQVDCVQSILRAGSKLLAFTVRFTDGTLLRVDGVQLLVEIVHESKYLPDSQRSETAKGLK